MKKLYARLVLWLIDPALRERKARAKEEDHLVKAYWLARGFSGGAWQAACEGASQVEDEYWVARGAKDGLGEALRRGLLSMPKAADDD